MNTDFLNIILIVYLRQKTLNILFVYQRQFCSCALLTTFLIIKKYFRKNIKELLFLYFSNYKTYYFAQIPTFFKLDICAYLIFEVSRHSLSNAFLYELLYLNVEFNLIALVFSKSSLKNKKLDRNINHEAFQFI